MTYLKLVSVATIAISLSACGVLPEKNSTHKSKTGYASEDAGNYTPTQHAYSSQKPDVEKTVNKKEPVTTIETPSNRLSFGAQPPTGYGPAYWDQEGLENLKKQKKKYWKFKQNTEYHSQFNYKGRTLGTKAIRPSLKAQYGPLILYGAGVFSTGKESKDFETELELEAAYGFDVGDKISIQTGAILYNEPSKGSLLNTKGELAASYVEGFAGVNFHVPLSPNLNGYYNINKSYFSLEGSIAKDLRFNEKLYTEFGAKAGATQYKGKAYEYAQLRGLIGFNLNKKASLYASANQGFSTEDTFRDTSYDPADSTTIADPTDNSTWYTVGLTSKF